MAAQLRPWEPGLWVRLLPPHTLLLPPPSLSHRRTELRIRPPGSCGLWRGCDGPVCVGAGKQVGSVKEAG